MPVNWKEPKAFERLLAAMVAAQEMKLDYRKIASMYGEGATYDAIEGRFRIIKREAAKLHAEIESGARPAAPPRGVSTSASSSTAPSSSASSFIDGNLSTPKKQRKPRSSNTTPCAACNSNGGKVAVGRVTKGGSPVKKGTANGHVVKGLEKEEMGSSEEGGAGSSIYEELGMDEVDAEGVAEGLGLGMGMEGYDGAVGFEFAGLGPGGEMEV